MTEEQVKPTTTGTTGPAGPSATAAAAGETGTRPAPTTTSPDVIEAQGYYKVARRDLYLAEQLTRSA